MYVTQVIVRQLDNPRAYIGYFGLLALIIATAIILIVKEKSLYARMYRLWSAFTGGLRRRQESIREKYGYNEEIPEEEDGGAWPEEFRRQNRSDEED